jgi:hypothetical protein
MTLVKTIISLFVVTVILTISSVAQTTCDIECGVTDDVIANYPTPNVYPLEIDVDVLYDRNYRGLLEPLVLYDAPDGNIIEDLGPGYNYLTVIEENGDWVKVANDKWVKAEILSEPASPSRFAGVELPEEGLPYTMAWTLRHLRGANTPGGEDDPNNPFLYRYSRVNVYAIVEVDGYEWYQIGTDQWVHQFDVAKSLPVERPEEVDTHKWVSVDLYEQVVVAYEGETPVFTSLISSGLSAWPTNEGIFHVYVRFPSTLMSGAYSQPDFYYLQDVPWTMYFDDDIALHGAYWHDGFGYRRSHGCVNLSVMDSYWLYNWADDEFDYATDDFEGPAVYVHSSGEYDD